MNIENASQPINVADKLRFSAGILAGLTLVVASGISCNDRETSISTPTPDNATTLTLEQTGADGSQNVKAEATPKIFECGIACIAPEDLQKLNLRGLTVNPNTLIIEPMPTPKIFSCNVSCIGPAAAETPVSNQ